MQVDARTTGDERRWLSLNDFTKLWGDAKDPAVIGFCQVLRQRRVTLSPGAFRIPLEFGGLGCMESRGKPL